MLDKKHKDKADAFVLDIIASREQIEMDGISDRSEKKYPNKLPIFDETFIGTKIEQLWEFAEVDGITKLIWCKGTVVSVSSN